MYEMVTGEVPFDADTPVSVALKHMQEEPEEPIEINPKVPEAVNKIILKAMQKDTTLRYQSATEMLKDLKQALKNPDGDFVEDYEYDKTARTQKIDLDEYGEIQDKPSNRTKKGKKEGKFKTFIKNHKALSIIVGLILLFSLSLGGTLAFLNVTNPAEVEMPNVVGLSKEEAEKEIKNAKLEFEVGKEEYDKEVPEGFIISQKADIEKDYTKSPPINKKVKEGSTVSVVVSKGQEKTKVPNVKGKEKEEAIKMIEDAKLKAEVIEETSKTVKEGFVISQETDPDTEILAGDTVKIHVSTGTGIKEVTVVSVIGQTEENAKKTLTGLGLKVNVSYDEDTSKDNGIVLKQSVDSGKTVDEGTTVTITVNRVVESKNATVSMNLKNITGGYKEDDENIAKTVKIEIRVNNEVKYTDSNIDKNTTKSAQISGKGTVDILVTITDSNGESWTRSQSGVNLNNTSNISF